MTQIPIFPALPLPVLALLPVEGEEGAADPAAFLALLGEDADPPEAVATGPALEAPLLFWPASPLATLPAPETAADGPESPGLPENADAPLDSPLAAETALLPAPPAENLEPEPVADRPADADDPDDGLNMTVQPGGDGLPAVEVSVSALSVPVPVSAVAVPPAEPAPVQMRESVAAVQPDRPAPEVQEDVTLAPLAPQRAVAAADSVGVAPSAPVGVEMPTLSRDVEAVAAAFGPQEKTDGGQEVLPAARAVPLLSPIPSAASPPASSPPAQVAPAGETAPGKQVLPRPSGQSGPIEGTTVVEAEGDAIPAADPPGNPVEVRAKEPSQPAMAREERVWRSLWPVPETGPAALVIGAAAVAVPGPEEAVLPLPGPVIMEAGGVAEWAEVAAVPGEAKPADVNAGAVEDPAAVSRPVELAPLGAGADSSGPVASGLGPGPAPSTPSPPFIGVPVEHPVSPVHHLSPRADPGQAAPASPVQVQIVQALSPDGAVTELRLAPEELGHVRIDLRQEGDRLVMTVAAERQDTLDLLRRHAGELAAELRAAGHPGLDLSFGRWSGPGAGGGNPPGAAPEAEKAPAAGAPLQAVAPLPAVRPDRPGGGLYLRI